MSTDEVSNAPANTAESRTTRSLHIGTVKRPAPGERVAIVAGLRTPFCKAGTELRKYRTVDLGSECVKELVARTELDPRELTLLVYGQVVPTVDWLNVAREVVIGAGLPREIDAYSVSRACATSIQALTDVAQHIMTGHHDVGIAGGADSTTDVPLKVSSRLRDALMAAQKAKTLSARLKAFAGVAAKDILPGPPGFGREPSTGEQMGEAAEKMAKLNHVSREEQDRIACASHQRAARAWSDGTFAPEVMTLLPPPYDKPVERDNLVRESTSIEALAKLPPAFDKRYGTITAGNASPLTDGASALLVMRESKAKALGYEPLGYLTSWAYAAVDPAWQLLMAPVFAAPAALARAGLALKDMDLIDMHEAFAAQVAANLRGLACKKLATEMGLRAPLGEVDPDKLNVNGGSLAIGHPFAATGGRMVLSTLRELKKRRGKYALLTLCAAGGLGAAVVLEAP
ncbi:MAG: acetyl-CoA C-acyltransferase FadI [Myxococcales bacterium]|nr:acetyl-CoA C-acyltransferase FadI [Myxococcales bacterium]